MKRMMVCAVLAMAGCTGEPGLISSPKPQPDPVLQRLVAACEAGNTDVCLELARMNAQVQAAAASRPLPQMPVYQNSLNPADFQTGPYQSVWQ